jgi:hypothetical protein
VVLDAPNLDGAHIVDVMTRLVDDDPLLAVVVRLNIGHRAGQ